jgi:hypothetical protein
VHADDLHVRVAIQKPDQLAACIPGAADNRDPDRLLEGRGIVCEVCRGAGRKPRLKRGGHAVTQPKSAQQRAALRRKRPVAAIA